MQAMRKADELLEEAERLILQAYEDSLDAVLLRHHATLQQLDGMPGHSARALLRRSGLLDDLTAALAGAARSADSAIQHLRLDIAEVVADDDGT